MKTIRKLTYQTGNSFNDVPELVIAGKFLKEKYGFEVGKFVIIEYLKDKIIITKVKE